MEEYEIGLINIKKTSNERYSKKWSERILQFVLYQKYSRDNKFFCKNKYIFKGDRSGWESDAFMVSGAGLSTEFEIKISRSDFAKEVKDKVVKHEFLKKVYESSGEYLRNSKYNPNRASSEEFRYTCPNYFFITCQEELIQPEEVEDIFPYAGLRWVTDDGKVRTKLRKKIHPLKINLEETLLYKFYYRTQDLENHLYDFQMKLSKGKINIPDDVLKIIKNYLKKSRV